MANLKSVSLLKLHHTTAGIRKRKMDCKKSPAQALICCLIFQPDSGCCIFFCLLVFIEKKKRGKWRREREEGGESGDRSCGGCACALPAGPTLPAAWMLVAHYESDHSENIEKKTTLDSQSDKVPKYSMSELRKIRKEIHVQGQRRSEGTEDCSVGYTCSGKSLSGQFFFVCEKDDREESSTKSLGDMTRLKDEMGSLPSPTYLIRYLFI